MTNQELAAIEELLSVATGETRLFAMSGVLSAARRLLVEVRRLRSIIENAREVLGYAGEA
jgi:hypothetical protein